MLLSLIFALSAFAVEGTFIKYHVNATENMSQVKALSVGHQSNLYKFLEKKWEAGFLVDHRSGGKSGGFGFIGVGIEPTAGPVYVHFFQNVGGITTPDAYLGGKFQFMEEVGIGIRDEKNKTAIGLTYKHISSAGLNRPNKGRDFIGIQVTFPWP